LSHKLEVGGTALPCILLHFNHCVTVTICAVDVQMFIRFYALCVASLVWNSEPSTCAGESARRPRVSMERLTCAYVKYTGNVT